MAFGATGIMESTFVLTVSLAATVPCPGLNDQSFFGGDLLRAFCKLLFVVTCIHICCALFMKDTHFEPSKSNGIVSFWWTVGSVLNLTMEERDSSAQQQLTKQSCRCC